MPYSDKILDTTTTRGTSAASTPGRPDRRHRARRRPGVRRRDEAADQGQPGHGRDRGRQVQDVRLRLARSPRSSLATEWLKGKTIDEAMAIKNTEIVEELALPPVKVHCSVLAEDAIKAAIKNYQEKQDAAETAAKRSREPVGGVSSHRVGIISLDTTPNRKERLMSTAVAPETTEPRREGRPAGRPAAHRDREGGRARSSGTSPTCRRAARSSRTASCTCASACRAAGAAGSRTSSTSTRSTTRRPTTSSSSTASRSSSTSGRCCT